MNNSNQTILHCLIASFKDEAVRTFSDVATIKHPNIDISKRIGGDLARGPLELRYWDSPDALNLFDLAPDPPDETTDSIRRFLRNKLPKSLLDKAGKQQRYVQERQPTGSLRGDWHCCFLA